MHESIEVFEATPEVEEYRELRILTGLSHKSTEAAVAGLPNSIYAVALRNAGDLVGMGRVIGDRGLFLQVVDVAIHPDYQGHGLGKLVMSKITAWINSNTPATAYVSLIADGEATSLYKQFGFKPTAPQGAGMALKVGTIS
jgi:GNAT superfamily N-acetyltransferase